MKQKRGHKDKQQEENTTPQKPVIIENEESFGNNDLAASHKAEKAIFFCKKVFSFGNGSIFMARKRSRNADKRDL